MLSLEKRATTSQGPLPGPLLLFQVCRQLLLGVRDGCHLGVLGFLNSNVLFFRTNDIPCLHKVALQTFVPELLAHSEVLQSGVRTLLLLLATLASHSSSIGIDMPRTL